MAGTVMVGDGISSNVAGMSKNQLYDIMCQMKALVEQNQQQAKQILVQNPNLTRALFQAQIMLGMLQPPQMIPNSLPAELQPAELQPAELAPRPSSQTGQSMPVKVSFQEGSASQSLIPGGKQQQHRPLISVASRTGPTVNPQPLPIPPNAPHSVLQPRGHLNAQAVLTSHSQSSRVPDSPMLPLHPGSQPLSRYQPQMSNSSLQTNAIQLLPTQPPLPQEPRPTSMLAFHHQLAPQMKPNMGFQHSGPLQMHHSQPMFHSGAKPPQTIRPPFSQGQSALPNLPPHQLSYPAGGSQMIRDFNSAAGSSMHIERESPWMPRQSENTARPLPPPPAPLVPSPMDPGNQPPGQSLLSLEMERSLVQQVMSLTPEQINLLPPEQRNQVFQLQQMLRK